MAWRSSGSPSAASFSTTAPTSWRTTTTQKHRLATTPRSAASRATAPSRALARLPAVDGPASLGALALAGAGDATASAANLAGSANDSTVTNDLETGDAKASNVVNLDIDQTNTNSGWAAGATALDLFGVGVGFVSPEQRADRRRQLQRGLRRLGQQRAGFARSGQSHPPGCRAQSLLQATRSASDCSRVRVLATRRRPPATRRRARTPRRSTTWRRRATRLR